jgi:hypothetical protein
MMLPSHAAFVPGIAIAVAQSPPLPELALLQSSVLALSLAYHRNFERTGALAQAEGASAKLLFLYGATQTLANCPAGQPGLFGAEACCLGLTLGGFVGTNFDKGTSAGIHGACTLCQGCGPRSSRSSTRRCCRPVWCTRCRALHLHGNHPA